MTQPVEPGRPDNVDRGQQPRKVRPSDKSEQTAAIEQACLDAGAAIPMKRGTEAYRNARAARAAELAQCADMAEANARGIVEPAALRLLGFIALVLMLAGCTPEQLQEAKTAAGEAGSKRDTICAFVEAWAGDMPELTEARQLCKAGADLKAVAAAYAGCK